MDTRFHSVYLLTSLDPSCSGDYYIGYTVNPLRRLRQHNGELVQGAKQTKRRGRPWTIVCCVSGFPEDRAALKFEWCWQNPYASARVCDAARALLSGITRLPFAVGALHLLIHADMFARLELTLHVFEAALFEEARAAVVARVASGAPRARSRKAKALPTATGEGPTRLPDLVPTSLFHVNHTTREAFAAAYLSHDANDDADESALAESARSRFYQSSLSALSQAVEEEWVRGEGEDEGSTTDSLDTVDILGDIDEGASAGVSTRLDTAQRMAACANGEHVASPHELAPSQDVGPPPPAAATATHSSPLHIPTRFKHFTEADFLRESTREQARLDAGQLPCSLCGLPLRAPYVLRCPRAPFCDLATHLPCLAMWALCPPRAGEATAADGESQSPLATASKGTAPIHFIPTIPFACPLCTTELQWGSLVSHLKQRALATERLRARQRRQHMEARLAERLERVAGRAPRGGRQATSHGKRARSASPTATSAASFAHEGTVSARTRGKCTSDTLAASRHDGVRAHQGMPSDDRHALTQPNHPTDRSQLSPLDLLADDLLFQD